MPSLKRARQSFTFEYKLKVIARADEIGNRAAVREFEIDESMIRYWQKKKDVMTKADRVFNMDEVPMSFDAPYSRTVDTTGAESIPVSTTGHEKTGFTVVLACSETGKKLKPMVVFKRKTMPKENLPDGVVFHCHNKGWMDRDGMAVWGEKVWRPRPVSFFDRTSLLIFDSFSAHFQN